jgi:hypothetical protein
MHLLNVAQKLHFPRQQQDLNKQGLKLRQKAASKRGYRVVIRMCWPPGNETQSSRG